MLRISSISKSYQSGDQSTVILEDVTYQLQSGHSLAITGPSGSGKSTLLHMIGALSSPDSGSIDCTLGQEHYPIHDFSETDADTFRRNHLGMVFQKFNLIEFLSARDNIELTAKHKGNFDAAYVSMLVDRLGITELLDKYPHNLSGGEQQRVAIARALAHKPALLLADEPTGNLDPQTSREVSHLLFDVSLQQQVMLIVVTHSHELATLAMHRVQVRDRALQSDE